MFVPVDLIGGCLYPCLPHHHPYTSPVAYPFHPSPLHIPQPFQPSGPPPSPKKTTPKQAVYVFDVKTGDKDLLLGIVAPAPAPKSAPPPAQVTRATVVEATANTVASG